MPKFSQRSTNRLNTCHPDLQEIFNHVIEHYDCSILEGHRSKERQEFLYNEGLSKVKAGKSKHNQTPSMAVDVSPYPIFWEQRDRFILFGGYVKAVADIFKIKIRWGGDWDGDKDLNDQTFNDLVHFELVDED